jgi:hypothetical protein
MLAHNSDHSRRAERASRAVAANQCVSPPVSPFLLSSREVF